MSPHQAVLVGRGSCDLGVSYPPISHAQGVGAGGGHGQAGGEDGQGQQQLGGPGHVLDMNHNSD